MSSYKSAVLSATPNTGAAYWTFNSPTRKANIHSIKLSLLTAVLSQIGLGTPANQSTPPVVSSSHTPTGQPSQIAATARVGTAWSTPPTLPTAFEDEVVLAAVIGSGWTFQEAPDGWTEVMIAGWRTLWNRNAGTAGQVIVSILYDE
jgi:hypothetical protein